MKVSVIENIVSFQNLVASKAKTSILSHIKLSDQEAFGILHTLFDNICECMPQSDFSLLPPIA
jgi:hypothetical protein